MTFPVDDSEFLPLLEIFLFLGQMNLISGTNASMEFREIVQLFTFHFEWNIVQMKEIVRFNLHSMMIVTIGEI